MKRKRTKTGTNKQYLQIVLEHASSHREKRHQVSKSQRIIKVDNAVRDLTKRIDIIEQHLSDRLKIRQ